MKIVYLSAFAHSWSTESHVARDAEALGHEVTRIVEPPKADNAFLLDLYEAARDSQLMLYTKSCGLPPEAISLWRQLEQAGVRTASYHLDLYVGLPRECEVGVDPFWRTGTVFTVDGDPE